MLFKNLFYIHRYQNPKTSFFTVIDENSRLDINCPDINSWLRQTNSVFIRKNTNRDILYIDYDIRDEIYRLKSSSSRQPFLDINFAFKNKNCFYAHVVPSSPVFKIKKQFGLTLIEQDYTLCFVFANVAKLYVVRVISDSSGALECEMIGSRLVVFSNEIRQDADIFMVPNYSENFLIIGVQLWISGVSYDFNNNMPAQHLMTSTQI